MTFREKYYFPRYILLTDQISLSACLYLLRYWAIVIKPFFTRPKMSGQKLKYLNPLSANPTKWSNKLKQFVGKLPKNCLSVFDHFVKLAIKGLRRKRAYGEIKSIFNRF